MTVFNYFHNIDTGEIVTKENSRYDKLMQTPASLNKANRLFFREGVKKDDVIFSLGDYISYAGNELMIYSFSAKRSEIYCIDPVNEDTYSISFFDSFEFCKANFDNYNSIQISRMYDSATRSFIYYDDIAIGNKIGMVNGTAIFNGDIILLDGHYLVVNNHSESEFCCYEVTMVVNRNPKIPRSIIFDYPSGNLKFPLTMLEKAELVGNVFEEAKIKLL